ncbi:MAG: M20/M25/M40 family metallo-hydrolase [Trueperaceae bacterium]
MSGPKGVAGRASEDRRESPDELGELLTLICQTPAPTFEEGERGRLIARLFRDTGLEPHVDVVGNVVASVPGGRGPRVLLAAHLDTVFAADVDVSVKVDGQRWRAPGVGDNSASLAVLVYLLRNLLRRDGRGGRGSKAQMPRLTVAATVGEEGLGDLRGARALLDAHAGEFDLVVAVDGHLGTIVDAAVGSKRYEVRLQAQGGHSWGDFPAPSATHALGAMVASLEGLKVTRQPRSTYNVGQVWGGTGVNAIAQEAGFNLDLRSIDASTLEELESDALAKLRRVAKRHRVEIALEKVGERPAATVANEVLVGHARDALAAVGVDARTAASSTDANIAMAAGIPAIAFGVYRGGDAHRMGEWLERPSLNRGYEALLDLLVRLAKGSGPKQE